MVMGFKPYQRNSLSGSEEVAAANKEDSQVTSPFL